LNYNFAQDVAVERSGPILGPPCRIMNENFKQLTGENSDSRSLKLFVYTQWTRKNVAVYFWV